MLELTKQMKAKILEHIEAIDIDVRELASYRNYGHPDQNYARFAEPDDEDWDEEEEWRAKIDDFIETLQQGYNLTDEVTDLMTDEEFAEYDETLENAKAFDNKVIKWLESL
jgi:hypothetical protein